MDDDRKLCADNVDVDYTVNTRRSHSEIMASLGYETPAPLPKKTKTMWEEFVEQFPCPSELQHKVWAGRIARQFRNDCGFAYDWDCECNKCESTLAEEITAYHVLQAACSEEELDTMTDVPDDELAMSFIDYRNACTADEPAPYRIETVNATVTMPPYGYVHVFTELSHVSAVDGPHTPFLTFLNVEDIEVPLQAPRTMWVRAKTVVPTHLSFK